MEQGKATGSHRMYLTLVVSGMNERKRARLIGARGGGTEYSIGVRIEFV